MLSSHIFFKRAYKRAELKKIIISLMDIINEIMMNLCITFLALYIIEICLQVAWMHFEQSAILTVNSHVITRNPRITVSHDKHRTWFLHINNVQQEDRGRYMCQINTITAKTQIGYLNVVGKKRFNEQYNLF